MVYIESFSNARFKWLKGLSRSRNRRKEGVFLMEGRVELELALRKGHRPRTIAFSSSYISEAELKGVIGAVDCEILELSKALFDALAYQQVPGNFMAVFEAFEHQLEGEGKVIAVFEGIEKPGNLGAALRTCDALGVREVIITESDIDLFNPNVIRNSRGAIFTVRCIFWQNGQTMDYLKEKGYMSLMAALSDRAVEYTAIEPRGKVALVMGAESKGLSEEWLESEGEHIVIPMQGEVDSLNVSVSFAIIASYFKRAVG